MALLNESAAKPWLLTIIRREYARTFERKRFPTVSVDELIAKEEPMLAAAEEQNIGDIRDALMKLPDEYREPLILQVLMGYSTAEIARELAVTACRLAGPAAPSAIPAPAPARYRPLLGLYTRTGLGGGVLSLEWRAGKLAFLIPEAASWQLAQQPDGQLEFEVATKHIPYD